MTQRLIVAAAIAMLAGPAFAASETFKIDPMHTYPSLEFQHMGISVWRGKFDETSGTIVMDRAAHTGSVEIEVKTTSINFGLAAMDDKARSEDFFDVAKYPTATYKGTLSFDGDTPKSINGEITLRGVTRPLVLAINDSKCITHPYYKKEVCGADAQGELHWSQFGMKKFSDDDSVLLHIQIEAMKPD